jgi:hypothetical protein
MTDMTAAKLIRIELKENFRGIKFSVTSDHNSVRIKWTNGPSERQVALLAEKYKNEYPGGCQTRYVSTARTITDDIYHEAFVFMKSYFGGCDHLLHLEQVCEKLNAKWHAWTPQNFLYRRLNKIDLSNGLNVEMLKV